MLRGLLVSSVLVLNGCTFVTSCPTGQGNNGNDNGGSNGNSQGNGGTVIGDGGEPPKGEWVNVTTNLAGIKSECGNMSYVIAKPDEDLLVAGVAANGLFRSEDGGKNWEPIPVEEGTDPLTNRTTALIFDPADSNVMWECGNYGSDGGIYHSTDGAKTFTRLGDTRHNELVSIDFSDPQRKTLLAGGHEQLQTLYKSVDRGKTWKDIGDKVPDEADVSSFPLILDADTYLLGVGGYGNKLYGIYRTIDGGETWELVSEFGGYTTPLVASDGSIYWPASNQNGLAKSEDDGLTWQQIVSANVLLSIPPIELPDGRIVSATKDAIVLSADGGKSWRRVTTALPFETSGVSYSAVRKEFVVWDWDCGDVVLDDAIFSYAFDYETQ